MALSDNEWSDDPLGVYLTLVGQIQPLDSDEEIACMDHVRAGDQMAEPAAKRLVEAHLRLVVSLAERYQSHGHQMLDLIESGNAGLLHAVQNLTDCTAGSFAAYATPFIERALAEAGSSAPTIPPHKQ